MTAGTEQVAGEKVVRALELTEHARQTPPPLPNKTNPTLEEMSRERDMGPAPSAKIHAFPLSGIELQQGKAFTPSKEIGAIKKQCCVRCNSHVKSTCQGAKTHLWHGPTAVFPKGATHASVSTLMVQFGGRLGTTPLATDEDKREAPDKIRAVDKWCTLAPKGPGASEAPPESAETSHSGGQSHHLGLETTRCSGFPLFSGGGASQRTSGSHSPAERRTRRMRPRGFGQRLAMGSGLE